MKRAIAGGWAALVAGSALLVAALLLPSGGSAGTVLPGSESSAMGPQSLPEAQPASAEAAARAVEGRALFVAKGCSTCHVHAAVTEIRSYRIGPELTDRRLDPAFLRAWLANPAAVRPGTQMPNLQLQPQEIEALIAFINGDSGGARNQGGR